MSIVFSQNSPIYLQLVEIMKLKIVIGVWPVGEKVNSVRDLALLFEVNPNTMQRALAELERQGFLYAERTAGRYVTKDQQLIEDTRHGMAEAYIVDFCENMKELGYSKDQIIDLIIKEAK
jgi:DNA-binding transcriptional regulator YhcF (GntR family)